MAGKNHQFILGLIIKKIRELGFKIIALDGSCLGTFGEIIKIPPKIFRHRPDVIAVNNEGFFCIGEAKTANDLNNRRIHEQILDYMDVKLNGKHCYIVIGIPQSSKYKLEDLLKKLQVLKSPNVSILTVPDEIINV